MHTKVSLLEDLIAGSKEYNQKNLEVVGMLEEMFWDGLITFDGDMVTITPMGTEWFQEHKNEL